MPLPLTDSHNISHGHVFIQTRRSRWTSRGATPRCEHTPQHCGCVFVSFGGHGNKDSACVNDAQQREAGEPRQQTALANASKERVDVPGAKPNRYLGRCFYSPLTGACYLIWSVGDSVAAHIALNRKSRRTFSTPAQEDLDGLNHFNSGQGGNVTCSLFISAIHFVHWF